MYTLGLLVILLAFIFSTNIIGNLSRAFHTRLRRIDIKLVAPTEIPDRLKFAIDAYAEKMLPDGFTFSHYLQQGKFERAISEPDWVAVHVNEEENTYAELCVAVNPDETKPFALSFTTVYENSTVMTVDNANRAIIHTDGNLEFHNTKFKYPQAQWEQHLAQLKKYEANEKSSLPRLNLNVVEFFKRKRSDYQRLNDSLVAEGYIQRFENGELGITWKAIKSIFFDESKSTADIGKHDDKPRTADKLSAVFLGKLESIAYTRHREIETNTIISLKFKIAAFFASLIACGAFMAFLFSGATMLFIIPVLILHELGHLAAMAAFGYTRKFMLFMPLGALVTGENDSAPTWQRIVVYLAGPVPGILLALGLLLFLPTLSDSMHTLVFWLLVVNMFNLLPVMPMDGGQIVRLTVSTRFPLIPFILHITSFISTLLIALVFANPFAYIMIIIVGYTLPQAYRNIGLFKSMKAAYKDNPQEIHIASSMFEKLRGSKLNFQDRYSQIRQVMAHTGQRNSAPKLASLAMLTYVAILIAPFFLIANNTGNSYAKLVPAQDDYGLSYEEYASDDGDEYLQGKLSNAESDDQRIEILTDAFYMAEYEDAELAFTYLNEAIALAEQSSDLAFYQSDLYSQAHTHLSDMGNSEQAQALFTTMLSKATESPDMQFEVAQIYQYRIFEADLSLDQKIQFSEQAIEIYKSLDETDSEAATLSIIAMELAQAGDFERGYSLLQTGIEEHATNNDASVTLYQALSEVYVLEGKFAQAYDSLIHARERHTDFEFTEFEADLAWIQLLNKNQSLAEQHFTKIAFENEQREEYLYEDTSFLTKLILKRLYSNADYWSPEQDTQALVLAHLENDLARAKKAYANLSQGWVESGMSADNSYSLVEHYDPTRYGAEFEKSMHGRKNKLVIEALAFALED